MDEWGEWILEERKDGFTLRRADAEELAKQLCTSIGGLKLYGWLVLDCDNSLWFFPGKENIPEKKDGEWIGLNPISMGVDEHPIPELLKEMPVSVVFTSV